MADCKQVYYMFIFTLSTLRRWLGGQYALAQPTGSSLYLASQLLGASFGHRFSVSHIRRVDNTIADAGSRQWSDAKHSELHSAATFSFERYGHWNRWVEHRVVRWADTQSLKLQLHLLLVYILECSQQGIGSQWAVRNSTIKGNLAGILHFMQAASVRKLLESVARLDTPSHLKGSASVTILEACFHALTLDDPTDQALWDVCYIVVTSRTIFTWFALHGGDITVTNSRGKPTTDPIAASPVCIRVQGSKRNHTGRPMMRMSNRSGVRFLYYVFEALLLTSAWTGLPHDILAAWRLKPCDCGQGRKSPPDVACSAGEGPARFGIHSPCASAINMYRAGVDAVTIQFHGRCS
ncbi:hypothetical protein PHMEG_00023823 [Phytophthora megakarya]|uniref:Uncharacterized protein n=1 Tax=Phytophthora megakarya TaxID=4795 RepID=A0A225VG22_9STRA|nr:hypothetical protein PHMEG_00023823 [Phytophthora megakarya]